MDISGFEPMRFVQRVSEDVETLQCSYAVTGSKSSPLEVFIIKMLNFFRPYYHYCPSSVHYCEDRFHFQIITVLHEPMKVELLPRFVMLFINIYRHSCASRCNVTLPFPLSQPACS